MKLTDITNREMIIPTGSHIHQLLIKTDWSWAAFRMLPQVAISRGTPRPRKLKAASSKINIAVDKVILTKNNEKININTADQSRLEEIPGVGEATAQKIIEYRELNGKFKTIEDIKNVSGIGDSKFENMKEKICVK